ncbi:YSC84-related protein [Amaricoccus sp.]|uniref:lipid-binding SYLF domain-containing protein n=1 Tax=Amaricoccus sp. TaxID=1872485 RepID=UPI001B4A07EC|nr:YSC84-related protein [Amaricoccus sp.]MBP7242072.1 twin-arginine translocation pathway signal [Amaricoccus sp.]
MPSWTRRGLLSVAAAGGVAACTTRPASLQGSAGARIDAAVDAAIAELYATVSGSEQLASRAQGLLVIPNITELGFFAGGAYGEGALRINGVTVDYFSLSAVSVGFIFGAQAYNQALYFLTPEALQEFRLADGWTLGVDAAVVVNTDGAAGSLNTASFNRPIVEVVYAQRGLLADASFAGAKYSRIYR